MSASQDRLPFVDLRADDAEIGRYGVLLDGLGIGLLIFAADGSLQNCNHQAEAFLGQTPTVWVDENGKSLTAEERLETQVIRTGDAVHQRAIGLRALPTTAAPVWCKASAFPVFAADGLLRRVLLTIADLRQHGRLASESQQLPTHDPLTGLFNQRYIQVLLDDEGRRARRYGTPFTLALLAIDNFPAAPDVAAHERSLLLSEVGRLISNILREFDMVGHFGSDEFLLILPNVRVNEGMIGLERLRETIEASHLQGSGQFLTVSGGVTEYSGEDSAALLERARSLLDSAREAGSNRLCVDLDLF